MASKTIRRVMKYRMDEGAEILMPSIDLPFGEKAASGVRKKGQ